ncbi:MAG: ABC transporter ATP-binding protein [Hyphomicrobiales bacterium]
MAAVTLLSTRGLSRNFGGLRAVDGVDLDIESGAIHAIIGPNGAGKTTLVSLICGRLSASSGTITFEGDDITAMPAHARVLRGIAYTFQITSIFANLSLFDNAALPTQRRLMSQGKISQSRLQTATMEALDRVGLADRAQDRAGALSYGHQRLLEIAMGLALQPKLLILDEPTQGLSEGEIAGFRDLMRDVASQATVLLIEHNMDVVMALADRITVLNFGRFLAQGTPADIRANGQVQAAYLGTEVS